MQENQRTIRPAIAVIVLICFFMPFVKISCGGQPIASITGLDLAIGKKIDTPSALGGSAGTQGSADNYRSDQSGNGARVDRDHVAAIIY